MVIIYIIEDKTLFPFFLIIKLIVDEAIDVRFRIFLTRDLDAIGNLPITLLDAS